jgi:monoamine oxidase
MENSVQHWVMSRKQTRHAVDTEVLIVGAGVAGLYAGYRLLQANVPFTILEAADHAGGRVFSRPERHSHLGLVLDEGANLINSTDTLALRLMNQFDINYVRRLKPGMDSMNYLVAGERYDQDAFDTLLFLESRSAINIIVNDQDVWRSDAMRDVNPKFIDESIASYLQRIGAGPTLRVMLKSFFWSEYGYEIRDLNLHVLFDYLVIDLACPCFKLIPNVDEAYTVPEGTGQITGAMEKLCHPHIHYGQPVVSITEDADMITVKTRDAEGMVTTLTTHHVFFAAPLHSLKKMEVAVAGITQDAVTQAGQSSYASGTKLHLKFQPGFDRHYRYSGILLTDTGEQIWSSGTGQGGAGLLTVLTGPLPPERAAAVAHTGQILKTLDVISPGVSELYVSMERSDAPMSYSGSLRPGESAHLAINDGGLHWTTIGEASGGELQGYLEGALRSADKGVAYYLTRRHAMKKKKSGSGRGS